ASLIRTIVEDENRLLTVSSNLCREKFCYDGVCIGVPARITRNGVFPIGVKMSDSELEAFARSVKIIKDITDEVFDILDKEAA
ncbi:MAG TPA: malate dehydrogenase, partial [Methanocorpusculum sp.]|nr:malate dehydrogenase [Methanocorpusculum sp.]